MNRLEAMTTLLAVVDAGSLSAASRRMRAPLATISRRISDLEKHLGAQLLLRSNRRLGLVLEEESGPMCSLPAALRRQRWLHLETSWQSKR